MLGFPAEHAVKLVLAGHEHGWVAGAARGDFARNFAAGDFFRCVDDFEDGKTAAVADVESFTGDRFNGFESADVGVRDIQDVNVIANASAIRRGVVRTEDFDVGDEAHGGVENLGDEMGFDTMSFAALRGGASSVEIAKSGELQRGVGAVVGEDFFKTELGFSVRIDGIFGMIFGDRHGVRLTVGGGGGGENEFSHGVAGHRVEEVHTTGDVGSVKGAGFADRLADESFAGKMHDRVDFVFGEDFLDLGTLAKISAAEKRLGRNSGGVALLKVIEGDDLIAASEENLRADAADVARCSGDKNVQGSDLAFA